MILGLPNSQTVNYWDLASNIDPAQTKFCLMKLDPKWILKYILVKYCSNSVFEDKKK